MKKTLILSLALLSFSLSAAADTIVFKDGMRVDASRVWVEKKEVRCEIGGITFGYPKADVERIEKGRSAAANEAITVLKVHKEVTAVSDKEKGARQKDTGNPDEKPAVIKQKPVAPKEPKAASQKAAAAPMKKKAVPAKKIPTSKSKKEKSPKTVSPQYASIPSFEEIINEDDKNPPVYIKRRRVLLVPRGLPKARIKALLLSYEEKLRNELSAKKARYKLIEVWVYDDFERADEGAAGWIGKISNGQKTGELSDRPVLTIR